MSRLKPISIRRKTSIRSRLTLWNVLALTVALTAVSVQIRYSVRANILASIDSELSSMARYGGRMIARHGRGRGPGSSGFGGTIPSPSFSGTMRQLDAQIGVSTPPGGSPVVAPQPAPVQISSQGAMPRQGESTQNGAVNQAPAAGSNTQQPNPPLSRMRNAIPNSPATRVLVNGPRTFLNEPPWDMNSYTKAVADNTDVFTTVTYASRSTRMLSHPVHNMLNGISVVQCTFPLAEMERAAHSLDVTLLTTIPLVLLLAGLGGAFLTDRAIRPVRQITRTAEQIGAEDLSRRLPAGTGDEFSQLSDTFNAMLGRLETSFAQQRRFTADASHELKSPLTVIKANASLALRSPRSTDEYVRRIEAIDKASNHMRRLVDDLLLLALADEGGLAADQEYVSLTEILKEAADSTHRPDAAQITLDLPELPMMMQCDRHDLLRLFCNLIENALRYTPNTGAVTVSAKDEGIVLCISISDTGEGISPEHIPHLGERFYRVEASRARTHGGSGLGLAICRSIVDAHNGDITFRSQEKIGTTVIVTLPVVIGDAS